MITEISRYVSEAAFFGLYVFFCLTLLKPRFSRKVCVPVYIAVVLCSCAAAAILTLNGKGMAALTLMPLIAYLPFSICAFVLSEGGISEGLAAFSLASLASLAASRIRMAFLMSTLFIPANISAIIEIALVLLLALLGADVALRYIRAPFRTCMSGINLSERRHLALLLPVSAFFLMIFINFNSSDSDIAVLITVITALAFFIIASRLLIYSAKIAEADAREKLLAESLEQQKKSFDSLLQSVDAGRFYRHDMRHHLNVLSGMARRDNSSEIVDYIESLNGTAQAASSELICKNPAINALLADYITRAEKLSCHVKTSVNVPEELPFELPDICVIFANAFENALIACEKCPENERYIDILAEYSDDSKLKISVKNSCAEAVELDSEGLPVIKPRDDGHGLGLRSVKKTVEKYDGFICCKYENSEFHFCAEIFRALLSDNNESSKKDEAYVRVQKSSKAASAALAFVVCALGIVNFSPDTATALSDVFSIRLKTLSYGWGSTRLNVKYPEFTGESSPDSNIANAAEIANSAARDFVAEAQAIFHEYALQKYEGYVALDAGYRVYIDDNALLSARFFGTLNAGGSADFSRCVVINKTTGEQLSLGDLFPDDYDYIAEISAEVLRQMEFRVEYQDASYFIPGGIWSDDECFKEISPEQEFYIDANGQLVIVFDEYTVAAGSEGSPEFIMPAELFTW
ncbi:MAG: GHKL domain-containing protein [Oscillospiraceae bacterium]|nr:GHKL domain-containing protein [Oscillospiraceae bacterium]